MRFHAHADEENRSRGVLHEPLDDVARSRLKHSAGADAAFDEVSVCGLEETRVVGEDAKLGAVLLCVGRQGCHLFTRDCAHDLSWEEGEQGEATQSQQQEQRMRCSAR